MPGSSRRPAPSTPRRVAGEAGFLLIEVMVSAVLVIVLALGTLKVIDGSQNLSSQQRSKGVASNLAHAALDRVRQSKFTTASNFTTTATPVGLDGRTYTVTTTGQWTSSVGSFSSCTTSASGNAGQYVRLTSTVTWPGMGSIAPVTAETLLAPRPGEVSNSTGSFVFTVQTAGGLPVSGATVTMNGSSLVTSTAGCVAFLAVPPGTYTATYAKAGGYVATTGLGTGSYQAVVTKGNASSKTVLLDVAAKITPVTFVRDDATTGPLWTSYSVSSNLGVDYVGSSSVGTPATSITNTSTTLFPFSSGYQVYSGNCVGNNPLFYKSTFTTTFPASAVLPGPGATVAATAYMRKLSIKIANVTKNAALGFNVYANKATSLMASCTESAGRTAVTNTGVNATAANTTVTITNTTTKAADVTFTDDLPYGVYSYCIDFSGSYYLFKNSTSPVAPYNNTPAGGTPAPTAAVSLDMANPTVVNQATTGTGSCVDNGTAEAAA
ncbi:MAG: hypothetical protein JWQ18_988 [Conexibacter sp.]|nr:hypothetical protein [Conexibacter sp.]